MSSLSVTEIWVSKIQVSLDPGVQDLMVTKSTAFQDTPQPNPHTRYDNPASDFLECNRHDKFMCCTKAQVIDGRFFSTVKISQYRNYARHMNINR